MLFLFLAAGACALGAGSGAADQSLEYLLGLTSQPGGEPADAPPALSCAWRRFAAQFATQIQTVPVERQRQLHEALQLGRLCGEAFRAAEPATESRRLPAPGRRTIFVDATKGSDAAAGTQSAPLQSLSAAVALSRAPKHEVSNAPAIYLRAGVYRLNTTLVLTPADSGLTIAAYDGEAAEVSGGRLLTDLKWKPCAGDKGTYVAKVPESAGLQDGIPALRFDDARATLARWPNANPEIDLFPAGHVVDTTEWLPPMYNGRVCDDDRKECGQSVDVDRAAPSNEWHGMYQVYTVGEGGACDMYEPPYSPWCSSSFYRDRWAEMHTRRPSGFRPTAAQLPHLPYKRPVGAVVHTWRPGHWYTWMFEVNGSTADGNLTFGRGGNQGGEGDDSGAEWWIENVREELDAPNEYFFDRGARELFFRPNGTSRPPAAAVVPVLANLIEIRGTQAAPVTDISLLGLTVTDNRPTFFDPRGNPSGGDWALERLGAVMVEGAELLTVAGCTFTRLDSNALFLSGYTRNVSIVNNTWRSLGQNAIAAWGRPHDFNNGTSGNFPRYTRVEGNWASELGIIQKQSSFYFQAETAESTIRNNVVYNIPRAAINFNDGFGGGAQMSGNLLFNTCRESSDHGAFNSWDRLPYITTVRNGTPSTIPAFNNVHHNFIVANYAADGGCFDNDDGSSYYDIHHNFCLYGGHKSDFDGHSKISSNNLHIYPSVYGSTCVGELQGSVPAGYAEGYRNNICVLPAASSTYMKVNIDGVPCDGSNASISAFQAGFLSANNTVYVPGGLARVSCNHVSWNASEWMAGAAPKPSINWTASRAPQPLPTTLFDWRLSAGAGSVSSRRPNETDIRSGGPGQASLALVDRPLFSRGHTISGIEIGFSYISGYGCVPGKCAGPANVSVVAVDAFNQSVVAELWRSPALDAYSFDDFKGYSPLVRGSAKGLDVEWPHQLQLGLQMHNNHHNLQIPVSSVELAVVWGGQGTRYPWKPEAEKRRPGYDETSRVVDGVPSPAEIIGWAKELLVPWAGGAGVW